MALDGAHHLGDADRDEEARADVAQQVIDGASPSARLAELVVAKVAKVSGTQMTPMAMPCTRLLAISVARVDIEVERHQPQAGDHLQGEAADEADARIHAADEDRQEEADGGADAARGDDLADQHVGKAGMLLQQRRQQDHGREVQHAVDRHQHQAERVVAVAQQAEIEERPPRRRGCGR